MAAASTKPGSHAWARRSGPWLGGALIAIIVAAAAFDVARHYRIVVQHTVRELETQARIISEQAARSIHAVDIVLRYIAEEVRRGHLTTLTAQELSEYLHEHASGLVQIDGITLRNAQGAMLAAAPPALGASVETSTEVLDSLRDDHVLGLLVGPVMGRANNGQHIVFARRLQAADGSFAGVVSAWGDLDYFQRFYRDIGLEEAATIALARRGGGLLARYPPQEPISAARSDAMAGNTADFVVVRPVPDYPLDVIVTRAKDVALAGWRAMAWGTAARTLALAAAAALLLWLLLRHVARLERARADLEDSRDRFALAAAGSNDGIIDWDIAGGRVFASARARAILGLEPGPDLQPQEQWFASLQLHPDDVQRRVAEVQKHMAGDTPMFGGDYRVRRPDGSYRWVHIRGLCERDESGRPVRMAGSVTDVDARRRAEDSLRESEARYALAMTGSNEGHWVWDIATDELYASPKLRELFHLPADLPITKRSVYVAQVPLHPEDRPRIMQAIDDHVAGRTPRYDIEYRIALPSGEIRWMHARGQCFRDGDGKPVKMAGSNTDITERKRTEEALRESERRFQLAIAGVNQGVWDWDLATDLVFMSARAQELLGQPAGEPLRQRRGWIAHWDYHPEDRSRVRRAVSDYLRGVTRSFEVEYRMRHADGTWRWYYDRGVALRDEHGRPYRMAGSIEDVTERKNAQAERDRFEAQLRQAQKLEAMGTLAGGIAHDFNNILAAILGYGEMAQKEAEAGTELRRHLDAAMSAGMRAKALVERILAFSRSGMGERLAVRAQSVVVEVLDALAASLPEAVRIERALSAGAASVLGDPTQLHQVVMNICANAVQALGAGGGTVTVSIDTVDLAEPRAVTTRTLPPGRYVRLRVADNGSGIEPQVLERIFDPFFTTKEVGVGTGLGLSLVHGIVSDLDGGVDVESALGAGSTFTVYVPQLDRVAEPPETVEESIVAGDGETVLLVDDETTLVQLGEEMIAELGYEPVGISSARAALELFTAEPDRFDLVLTDEAMPGMTGTELAAEIRRIRADIPIVVMSGYASADLAARARDVGAIEVLAKPLAVRDIARSLAAALGRSHASTEPAEHA